MKLLFLIALMAGSLTAKDLLWIPAKLVAVDEQTRYGRNAADQIVGSRGGDKIDYTLKVVGNTGVEFIFRYTKRHPLERSMHFATVPNTIQIAKDKHSVYVRDEDGHKFAVKVLRMTNTPK
jgi:hypothetical protein